MSLIADLHLDELSLEDRMVLVEELWDSIAASHRGAPLTATQVAELDRRLEEDDKDPDAVIPWDEIRAATLARLQR